MLDLHTHSVFSDGHVWATIRVSEALRDGLDGLAITEHLEFQPHLADIPHPDRNRAYEEALFAKRTIVWWKDVLIGRQAHIDELLAASLSIDSVDRTP